MKKLYESILRPDSIDDTVVGEVELQAVLKRYRWLTKSARFNGDTLKVVFDGRGYMDDFEKVAEALHCKSFDVYPWAIIEAKNLDGYRIKAATRLDITCANIQNCVLEAGHRVMISGNNSNDKIKLVRNEFISNALRLNRLNGATMVGNDFGQIGNLTITHMGPKIEKIALGWNYVTRYKNAWTTYPRPDGKPDLDLDPLKSLGLDKHFKNLKSLTLSLGCTGTEDYIQFNTPDSPRKYGRYDWGVDGLYNLNSGWQTVIIKDARCV